jgi:DNA-binding NtrC family response regulator
VAQPQAEDTEQATVEDILIMDGNQTVLQGLERVLRGVGLSVTALTDPERARDQLAHRFFPVVLIDLDTPRPLGGLDMLRFCQQHSPLTAVIVMTPRRSFDAVASAFRAGAADVVPKTDDALPYLRDRVRAAASTVRGSINRDKLLEEVAEIHESFFKEMMDLSRQVADLEEKLQRGDGDDGGSTASVQPVIDLLCVDHSDAIPARLTRELNADSGWRVRVAQTGGEALDASTQRPPQVLVVRDPMPDLPVTMLVKSVKVASPDLVSIAFRPPGERGPGEIKMVESSKMVVLVPMFSEVDQLITSLQEVKEALRRKARERRYHGLFRMQHAEFLKRYQRLKQKLARKR